MSTDGYDTHYLVYIQRTMEAIRDLVSEKSMTIHEIRDELPYLDLDSIREAIKHLIMDFEVAELYVSTKVRCPDVYEQIFRQGTFKNTRNQSPLRKQYKDLLEVRNIPIKDIKV